jgi:hypothetical protein
MTDDQELPCKDKLVFDHKRGAETAALVAMHQRGVKLKAYQCRYCQLWHLSTGYIGN